MEEQRGIHYGKRLVKGSTAIFTAMILSTFVALFLRGFLGRAMVVADYGLFFFIFSLFSFIALFYDLGFCKALIKHIPEFCVKKKFSAIKSSVIFVTLLEIIPLSLIVIGFFAFSNQIALAVFGTEAAVIPLRILGIWFFINAFYRILNAIFQGFQNMGILSLMRFFLNASVFVMAVVFVGIIGWGISGVAFAYLAATLIMVAFGFMYLVRRYPHILKEKATITKPLVKKLSFFALPVFIGSLGALIFEYSDTLLIGILRTNYEVGLYQSAQPIARILWFFPGALSTILFPMFSEMWTREEKTFIGRGLHFLTKFSFAFIIPAGLVIIAFPEIIIRLIFGEGYLGAATALQILCAASILYTLFVIFSAAIVGMGKPVVVTIVVSIMGGLNLISNLLLIPIYGIEGAATALFATYAVGVALLFWRANKLTTLTMPAKSIFKTVVGGVFTLFLIVGLKTLLMLPAWPEAFIVMVPSALFYGLWILATHAITKDDLKLVAKIVPVPKRVLRMGNKFLKE